jgi:hypothetical protein
LNKSNHFIHGSDKLEPYFYTKSNLWEYEQEVRIILMDSLIIKNPIHIDATEIGEIIFGLKTPDKQIALVKDIINHYPDSGNYINLYKCIEAKGHYALEKIPL